MIVRYMRSIFVIIVIVLSFSLIVGCSSTANEQPTTEIEESLAEHETSIEETPFIEEIPFIPDSADYDDLQQLYIRFPMDVSIEEAISFLDDYGLPYSNQKYNGSRCLQVSTDEEGTAQKYNKSRLTYVTINYKYDSNNSSENMSKYSFSSMKYIPNEGYYSFEASNNHNTIRRLGTDIGQDISREEQIVFYYQHKDE